MLKIYFKQAWTMMKQNRLFTFIYVIGTGLSIALVMTLFIIFYVKFAPVYPEYNRNRTLVISTTQRTSKANAGNWSRNSGTSYEFTTKLLGDLKHAEAVAAVGETWGESPMVSRIGTDNEMKAIVSYVNAEFWRVFTFNFTSGIPFTPEEVEAKRRVAVISEGLAQQLFANISPVGDKFYLDGTEITVVGVVQNVSNATPVTAGDLWLPITLNVDAVEENPSMGLMGNIKNYILAPTRTECEELRAEVLNRIETYNQADKEYTHEFFGQPDIFWKSTFRTGSDNADFGFWDLLGDYFYIFLTFLIIPALNLSGMISNRMDSRMEELGVRKAYGATNKQIIRQVLWENMLLTFMGGLVGLLLSYLIVVTFSNRILTLFDSFIMNPGREMSITFEMLFNPVVFGSALLFCVLLNLISALVPTIWALRRNIISCIHSKR